MAQAIDSQNKDHIFLKEEDIKTIEDNYNRKFSVVAREHQVSWCKSFWIIFRRNMLYTVRNPISIVFLFFIAFYNSFLHLSLFYHIGREKFIDIHPDAHHPNYPDVTFNQTLITNYVGLAFLACCDQFVTCSFAQVMQVPQIYPVFVREASNSMYTVSAFFAAAQLVSFCTLFYYPVIIASCTFFNFGLEDHTF
jgi:hypothetical protein